jgi:hypothetical protein
LLLGLTFTLGACGHNLPGSDDGINTYPANYKSDILAAMHAYLNNPTGIRDAGLSEPTLKSSGNVTRYVACLRFMGGRLDRFVETPKQECTGATYAAFPELQNLPP